MIRNTLFHLIAMPAFVIAGAFLSVAHAETLSVQPNTPPNKASAQVVKLIDMVEKTIAANPEVQARYHRLLESGFEQEVVRGGFLPKADIISTYRKQDNVIDIGGNTAIPRMNNELVLRQMIFDGFATRNEVDRLGHANLVRYYELQSAMQNTTLEFMRAYVDTLRFRELTEYAKDNYIAHKQLFDRIKERVDAGVARKVDLEQATGRLALAEANLLTETTNLYEVTARLQRLYGELPPENLERIDFADTGVEPTATDALNVAYRQNPDLLSTIEDIEANKNEIKAREARYLPRFDLQARKNLGTSSDGKNSTVASDVFEVTMNFNLFNGFSDQYLVKQTAQKLNGAHDMRDKACVDTRQLLVIAYNDIRQLNEQLNYRLQHKNAIENARIAYRKQFDIGQRTLLDLLDTENEYFQARRSYSNAAYDIQLAYARTYAAQGALTSKLGAKRGGLPEVKRADYLDRENVCQAINPVQMEIDKEALLANAPPLSNTLTSLNTPVIVRPTVAPITTPSVQALVGCSVPEVTGKVNDWAEAWRKKDVNTYLGAYASNFTPQTGDKASWEKQRRQRLSTNGKIDLSLNNVEVMCEGDKARATFTQNYKLTTFKIKKTADTSCEVCNMKRIPVVAVNDTVTKELQFARDGGEWKIMQELVK